MSNVNQKLRVFEDVTSATGSDSSVNVPKVPPRYADESFKLFSKIHVEDQTLGEALRIKRKLVWRIIPFLCVCYHLMYIDKQTVRVPISFRH